MKEIVEYVAKNLVSYPEDIVIEEHEENGVVDIKLLVNSDDMGKIIGKQGRIANSIRSILKACAIKEQKKVNLEIDSK
ncbi:MAG: KH domain-containing protein [Tissierellia bacterium]|nr:KH domain-containing protein [Tissierellia bacterium]